MKRSPTTEFDVGVRVFPPGGLIIPHKDGSHTVVTASGNWLTVPPGVIPPNAAYVDKATGNA